MRFSAPTPVTDLPARPRAEEVPFLLLRGIVKVFPGVVANDRVTLEVRSGEVHALLGENGAGKTTLVNVLYGIYQPDAGEILLEGRPVRIRSPRDAIALGIGMVPQHPQLVRRHTVAENIALGLPGLPFFRPLRMLESRIRELAERYGLAVDPRARVADLSAGEQQRVEILRVLVRGARVLVLDEPTTALTPQEARTLFRVLRRMREEGCAVILITHRLDEVMEASDRVTVLRRGQVVGTLRTSEAEARQLARLMVGREVQFGLRRTPRLPGSEVLVLEDVWASGDGGVPALRGVSLEVRSGEVFGLAGVAGNGQRECVEVCTGLRRAASGRVHVLGREVVHPDPRRLHQAGVAHVPEDRVRRGVVGSLSVAENLVLKRYRQPPFARGPFLDRRAVEAFARRLMAAYAIDAPDPSAPARVLSGGNLQRLILARELAGEPRLIVAAHPTSGLDVAATQQVRRILLERRDAGAGVFLVSEDLEEILELSDRIGVMFRGRVVGVLSAEEANPERVGLWMMGHGTCDASAHSS
ncbi:MAG: ABC transporter ATP-binding protein [Armatimonadota bacterium]|nr:ABC transporter ATP-binding protein [Armatimonadota bacterium]